MATTNNNTLTLQAAFLSADMRPGEKYTIFHLGHEHGFPMAQKITFVEMELTKYAQYSDAVKLVFRPFKKRNLYTVYFYNESFIICRGWHDLNEKNTHDLVKSDAAVTVTKSKYRCFDARYIEDAEKYLPDVVSVYKCFKKGVDGRLYA